MATGKSGVIQHTLYNDYYIAKHGYSYVDVYWEEEYDVAANTSVIKVTKITFSHSKYGGTWSVYGTVTIDGTAYSFSSSMTSGGTITNPITSNAIYHDDATGAKTITISTAVNTVGGSGGTQFYSGNHGTASVSVALTTIPRLSELSARGGTLGTAQTLSVTQKSSSYTHTITYVCGSASGTICTKSSGLSISWTPPISLASQNTTGTSVPITLTITTYSGDTAIGSKETGITCTIPTSVCLKVSDGWATVSPYNTGSAAAAIDAYVQGYSKAAVVFDDSKISTDDAYGATIQSYRITCGGKQYTSPYQTDVLSSAGAVTVTVTVIDSRGYGVNEDFTVNVAAYANPVLSGISVFRCNSSGVAADDGTYLSVTAKANISSVEGLNTCTMELAIGSLMTVSVPDSETIIVGDGLVLSTSTYSVRLTLTDSLGNRAVYTQKIPTAEVFFHGRTGGSGAAFGKYAEADDLLDVNWDIRARKKLHIDGALSVGDAATTRENLGITPENIGAVNKSGDTMTGTLNLPYLQIHREGTGTGYVQFFRDGVRSVLIQQIVASNQLQICQCPVGDGTYVEGYKFPTPATSLTAHTWYDLLTSKTVKDYVVAQGTSGIWTYRKWNSGAAECWGKYSYSGNGSTAHVYINASFPFTFTAIPVVNVTTSNQSVYDHWVGQVASLSTSKIASVKLFCNSNESVGGTMLIHVSGKWK